jgi:hypothetical protein
MLHNDEGGIPPVGVTSNIVYVFDGGSNPLTSSLKGDISVDFNCTIKSVTLLADVVGSIAIDVWKDTFTNYPPVVGKSITASSVPTITSDKKYFDATLTGWTKTITAGDVIRFNINSVETIARASIILSVAKT